MRRNSIESKLKSRKSRVNRAHSPIVENNYFARAHKVHSEDIKRETERKPIEIERKVSKVVGIGRHRALIAEDIEENRSRRSKEMLEEDLKEDSFQNRLLCGCLG